jgi:hypothetical protein
MDSMAVTAEEKTYKPSWRDVYRTTCIELLMQPMIGKVLTEEHSSRRLVMTHGFAKATSFSVACGLYFWTTMIILKNFSLVKDLFNQDQYLTERSVGKGKGFGCFIRRNSLKNA